MTTMKTTFLCLLATCLFVPATIAQETLPTGIVKEKPTEGIFVETEQGYMVPYTETIPGTDIRFEMVPIPGGTFNLGSPEDEEDRNPDEGPQVCIEVAPFQAMADGTADASHSQRKALHPFSLSRKKRKARIGANHAAGGKFHRAPTKSIRTA